MIKFRVIKKYAAGAIPRAAYSEDPIAEIELKFNFSYEFVNIYN
ncbi:hypothetical protein [Cryomorpha ignava]|nr:hypothetical protein [Cryomorpha ignava]